MPRMSRSVVPPDQTCKACGGHRHRGVEPTRRPDAEDIGSPERSEVATWSGAHLQDQSGGHRQPGVERTDRPPGLAVRGTERLTIPGAAGLLVRAAEGRRLEERRADDFRSGRSTGWRSGAVTIPGAGRPERPCARSGQVVHKPAMMGHVAEGRRAAPSG